MEEPVDPALAAAARRAALLDEEALLSECDLEFFVGSGPGGQHRNKTASAVRLLHRPTGVTAAATERRSQHQNRQAALDRLRARFAELSRVPKPRKKTRPSRAQRRRRLDAKLRRARVKQDRQRRD